MLVESTGGWTRSCNIAIWLLKLSLRCIVPPCRGLLRGDIWSVLIGYRCLDRSSILLLRSLILLLLLLWVLRLLCLYLWLLISLIPSLSHSRLSSSRSILILWCILSGSLGRSLVSHITRGNTGGWLCISILLLLSRLCICLSSRSLGLMSLSLTPLIIVSSIKPSPFGPCCRSILILSWLNCWCLCWLPWCGGRSPSLAGGSLLLLLWLSVLSISRLSSLIATSRVLI
mmetsp:Transcript_14485/g.13963  ORF Transcript_14485/g.13963 Transcript_14485/m.13963 type:complete len:229 (+) Transcript_14485:3005-3691(+)